MCLLLRLELPRRLHLRGAPRGIKAGQRGCQHGENDRDRDIRRTEVGKAADFFGQERSQTQEAQRRQRQPEQSARQSDHARLDQTLAENGPAAGTQRAAHADVAGAAHDFRQHEAHGIEQTHQEKAEADQDENLNFLRDCMLIDQPFAHVANLRVRRPVEAPGSLLIGSIVIQEGAIAPRRPPRLAARPRTGSRRIRNASVLPSRAAPHRHCSYCCPNSAFGHRWRA